MAPKKKKRVVITVEGGVVDIDESPDDVDVYVIDYDIEGVDDLCADEACDWAGEGHFHGG